jgi:3-oxoacyl-[acyl-carrier-protein] synthase-1
MRYGLTHLGIINALGNSQESVSMRLFAEDQDRLQPWHLKTTSRTVPAGKVWEDLPDLPDALAAYRCRNHRLAYAAYLQIKAAVDTCIETYGAHRIGIVLGSSTAGLDATEAAYRHWKEEGQLPPGFDYHKQHAMGSVARFVAEVAGITGPNYTISTACTSSAKAFVSAAGLLDLGICDVVLTGGVDTLCHMTLNGFEALGAVSGKRTNPMSRNREGLNIGEGAAFFLIQRDPSWINYVGGGESCDAYHMSSPHPEGEGALASMRLALEQAQLDPHAIAYVNMHGTGTVLNDSMESKAIAQLFSGVPVSSTKPLTGHTLGAAGAMEAAFCMQAFEKGRSGALPLPAHYWDGDVDPELPRLELVEEGTKLPQPSQLTYFLSNSFAFGGNNCSLIFELDPDFGSAS